MKNINLKLEIYVTEQAEDDEKAKRKFYKFLKKQIDAGSAWFDEDFFLDHMEES